MAINSRDANLPSDIRLLRCVFNLRNSEKDCSASALVMGIVQPSMRSTRMFGNTSSSAWAILDFRLSGMVAPASPLLYPVQLPSLKFIWEGHWAWHVSFPWLHVLCLALGIDTTDDESRDDGEDWDYCSILLREPIPKMLKQLVNERNCECPFVILCSRFCRHIASVPLMSCCAGFLLTAANNISQCLGLLVPHVELFFNVVTNARDLWYHPIHHYVGLINLHVAFLELCSQTLDVIKEHSSGLWRPQCWWTSACARRSPCPELWSCSLTHFS